jgi:hypothetical protein
MTAGEGMLTGKGREQVATTTAGEGGPVTYWVLWYLFLGTCLDQSWSAQIHRVISSISSSIRKFKSCFSSSMKTLFLSWND